MTGVLMHQLGLCGACERHSDLLIWFHHRLTVDLRHCLSCPDDASRSDLRATRSRNGVGRAVPG